MLVSVHHDWYPNPSEEKNALFTIEIRFNLGDAGTYYTLQSSRLFVVDKINNNSNDPLKYRSRFTSTVIKITIYGVTCVLYTFYAMYVLSNTNCMYQLYLFQAR